MPGRMFQRWVDMRPAPWRIHKDHSRNGHASEDIQRQIPTSVGHAAPPLSSRPIYCTGKIEYKIQRRRQDRGPLGALASTPQVHLGGKWREKTQICVEQQRVFVFNGSLKVRKVMPLRGGEVDDAEKTVKTKTGKPLFRQIPFIITKTRKGIKQFVNFFNIPWEFHPIFLEEP